MSTIFDVTAPRYFADTCFLPEDVRSSAKSIADMIARSGMGESNNPLPQEVQEIIIDALRMTASGQAIAGIPLVTELTPSQAAEFLGVSEPFLLDLLRSGKIASRSVNGTPLTVLQDVLEYKQERKRRRLETVDELVKESQQLGLY